MLLSVRLYASLGSVLRVVDLTVARYRVMLLDGVIKEHAHKIHKSLLHRYDSRKYTHSILMIGVGR